MSDIQALSPRGTRVTQVFINACNPKQRFFFLLFENAMPNAKVEMKTGRVCSKYSLPVLCSVHIVWAYS